VTAFAFGNTLSTDQANFGSTLGKTAKVGSYSANAWGVHDMHGNAQEWVEDTWHPRYAGAPSDGSAWVDDGGNPMRVLRGGGWASSANKASSHFRVQNGADIRNRDTGFRVVRELP